MQQLYIHNVGCSILVLPMYRRLVLTHCSVFTYYSFFEIFEIRLDVFQGALVTLQPALAAAFRGHGGPAADLHVRRGAEAAAGLPRAHDGPPTAICPRSLCSVKKYLIDTI